MTILLIIAGLILFLVIVMPIASFAMPHINKLFDSVWQDPRDAQSKQLLARVAELHIDGNVPEETAVMIAASEEHASEKELFDAVGALDSKDVMNHLFGKKRGGFLHAIAKNFFNR